MTDAEKADAFARWNHDTTRPHAGTWDAFMAGIAAAGLRWTRIKDAAPAPGSVLLLAGPRSDDNGFWLL